MADDGSGALGACFFCVLGSAIAAASANTGNYTLLIAGRIVMGLGSIVLETAQSKLYAHWFSGSWLATVIAIDLAWNSVTVVIARVSAVPMASLGGWYGWALWIPCIVCAACTAVVIAYGFIEHKITPHAYRPVSGREVERRRVAAGGQASHGMINRLRTSVLNVLRL
jgi:MFS family permease